MPHDGHASSHVARGLLLIMTYQGERLDSGHFPIVLYVDIEH